MQVTLREVNRLDAKMLYHLLGERPKLANISHHKMPTFEFHEQFVMNHPYDKWYIIEAPTLGSSRDVGSVSITSRNEIGIGILKKFHRLGYAQSAIKELMHLCPRLSYYANISPRNVYSVKMFKKMGFDMLQYTLKKGDV